MNALRAFEAVSRLGSVSKAADELCVSQGAVSQQLRNLEDHLGREMFVRSPNSFLLSADGEAFARVVQQSLKEIALAADDVKQDKNQRSLTISVGLGVADKWLMPRLGRFYDSHPDVTVALDKNRENVSFRNDGIDAAIRFGDGTFEDLESVFLFPCTKFAVASPGYIAEYGKPDDLANPKQHRLIDCRRGSKKFDVLCGVWEDVVASDYTGLEEQLIILPDDHQALNAAVHGRGIALTFNYLMGDEIKAGNIVYAHDQPLEFRGGIYFVSPTGVRPSHDLEAFREWLVEISEEFRTAESVSRN